MRPPIADLALAQRDGHTAAARSHRTRCSVGAASQHASLGPSLADQQLHALLDARVLGPIVQLRPAGDRGSGVL